MVEATEFGIEEVKDLRNLKRLRGENKKRLNEKETRHRDQQTMKRSDQKNGPQSAEEIKAEFDEINADYLKKIELKRRADEKLKKEQEKKQIFENDLINFVVGPEPKDDNKKKIYDQKVTELKKSNGKSTTKSKNSGQQAAYLEFLKKSLI